MNKLIEAFEEAVIKAEGVNHYVYTAERAIEIEAVYDKARDELKAALAAPQGEPYGYFYNSMNDGVVEASLNLPGVFPLYEHPAPAPLSDEQLIDAWVAGYYHAGYTHDRAYADKLAMEYVRHVRGSDAR